MSDTLICRFQKDDDPKSTIEYVTDSNLNIRKKICDSQGGDDYVVGLADVPSDIPGYTRIN